ncbi:hypothetical protein L195_g043879, partial [Trifolium pratense]
DGNFTVTVKVFRSSGVVSYNKDTMKVLGNKHLYRPPPSTPTTMFVEAPHVVGVDNVLKCIRLFLKGTSCGRDGLRVQHLLDAIYPISLLEFVASMPLTLLLKTDGGIRLIAVDTIWRYLVSKIAMKGDGKDVANISIIFNLGLEYQVVFEAVLHNAKMVLIQ